VRSVTRAHLPMPAFIMSAIRLMKRARISGDSRSSLISKVVHGGFGHPVAFARSRWELLLEVTGDAGARQFFRDLPMIQVAVGGNVPRDVDTPEDLAKLHHVNDRNGPAPA
jgi:CTP:molybdopterin cytidylyltransferase MocA